MDVAAGTFVDRFPATAYYNRDWGFGTVPPSKRAFAEGRKNRRRARYGASLREAYHRLMSFDNGDDYVNNLFSRLSLSKKLRDDYTRTHRVVGPGATLARDYVSVWVSPTEERLGDELRGLRDFSRTNVHLLEDFIKDAWYRDRFGGTIIEDIAELSITSPQAAAKQAQTFLRAVESKNAVVNCGEFCRSRNVCRATFEKFSAELGKYEDQVRCYLDGNWIQLIGPNGLGDWEIAAHVSLTVAARDLYNIIVKIGYEYALLLFENEISVLNMYVSRPTGAKFSSTDSVDYSYDPYCGDSEHVTELDSDCESPAALTVKHDEVVLGLNAGTRSFLEEATNSLEKLKTERGSGCKVHIGANTAITVTHLMGDDAKPGELVHTDLGNGLTAVIEPTGVKQSWRVREPVVGESCFVYHIVGNRAVLSEPVVISEFHPIKNCLVTNRPVGVKKGDSGSALISCVDFALLGLLQGASSTDRHKLIFSALRVENFWSLAFSNWEIRPGTSPLDVFIDNGLKSRLIDVVKSMSMGEDGNPYIKVAPTWMYCLKLLSSDELEDGVEYYATASMRLRRHRFPTGYSYVDSVSIRKPISSERIVCIGLSERKRQWSFTASGFISDCVEGNSQAGVEFDAEPEHKVALVLSTVDCTLLGFHFVERGKVLEVLSSDFNCTDRELIFPGKTLGFLADSGLLKQAVASNPKKFLDLCDGARSVARDQEIKVGPDLERRLAERGITAIPVIPWNRVFDGMVTVDKSVKTDSVLSFKLIFALKEFFAEYGEEDEYYEVLLEKIKVLTYS